MKPARPTVSFAEAFRFWVKLGFISFGGPAGQIAIMHRELVERRRWLSEERFLHALNYCMLLPGPEAQQLAIYIGWLMHRTLGGIIAGAFFVIPSIFVLMALSYIYAAYGNVSAVAGILAGFKPVVVAIVVEAILKIGQRALKATAHFIIAAAAFVAIYFLHIPFPLIVLAAGLVGLLGARARPSLFAVKSSRAGDAAKGNSPSETKPKTETSATVIDDLAPAHTRPSGRRAMKVLAVGLALWAMPMLALILWRGSDSLHAQEYRFFTQAAFVTFGGAYAVLAYVTQAAAGSFGWITHTQAIDGLALAETTPGPLIMVLQFVGFMAGWNNPGDMGQTASAITGALVTTYTTFLPCFIFIFLGAPYIEVLRGNKSLTSALSGVTAAVVGVVLNLALVFGMAVIFPQGLKGEANWFAAVMSASAFIALYRLKADVLWVVLAGGLIGLVRAFL
ncbi:MAG: chromate efflux transporter [Blastocatellia bacterium]|nr:chromate efflux transporter [Blastocatellia bacterium]